MKNRLVVARNWWDESSDDYIVEYLHWGGGYTRLYKATHNQKKHRTAHTHTYECLTNEIWMNCMDWTNVSFVVLKLYYSSTWG